MASEGQYNRNTVVWFEGGDNFATMDVSTNGQITYSTDHTSGLVQLKSVRDPSLAQDAATKNYVDAQVSSGGNFKDPVVAATVLLIGATYGTGSWTGAPDTLDGVSLAANDRVLVFGETPGYENGIYEVTTLGTGSNGVWDRVSDLDTGAAAYGAAVFVSGGGTYDRRTYIQSADITVGDAAPNNQVWEIQAQAAVGGDSAVQFATGTTGLFSGNKSFSYNGSATIPLVGVGTDTSVGTLSGNLYVGTGSNATTAVPANVFLGKEGGLATIKTNDAATATNPGGAMLISTGDGNTTGNGGAITISAGDGGSTDASVGGAVSITAGTSTATNGDGGDLSIAAGEATGTGTAGVVNLGSGTVGANANVKVYYNIAAASIVSPTQVANKAYVDDVAAAAAVGPTGSVQLSNSSGDFANSSLLYNSAVATAPIFNIGNESGTAITTAVVNVGTVSSAANVGTSVNLGKGTGASTINGTGTGLFKLAGAGATELESASTMLLDAGSTLTMNSATTMALNSTSSMVVNSGSTLGMNSTSGDLTLSTVTSGNVVVDSADVTPGASDLTGTNFRVAPQTITAAAAEDYAFTTFATPVIAGSTTGTAATVYIQAEPTGTVTTKYALWVDSGVTQLDGVLRVGDGTTSTIESSGSATTVNLFNDDALTTLNFAGGMNPGGTLNMASNMSSGTINIGSGMDTGLIDIGGAMSTGTIQLGGATDSTTNVLYARTNWTAAVPSSVVNKSYVDSVASGLLWKEAVVLATIAGDMAASTYATVGGTGKDTITWVGVPTIDGETVAVNDRILVKDDAATTGTNSQGIYVVTSITTNLVMERSDDALGTGGPALQASGAAVFVYGNVGASNNDKGYVCVTDGPVDFGADISFSVFTATGGAAGATADIQFNDSGTFSADTGVFTYLTGSDTLNILSDTASLVMGADSDLTISSNGAIANITNTGLGAMTITNTPAQTFNLATTTTGTVEVGATAGTVSFNSTVAATSPTVAGVTLDGGLGVAGDVWTADNGDVIIGTGGDLTLAHDGTDSTITNTTGAMTLTSSGTGAMTITNTPAQTFNLATTTTGTVEVGATAGTVSFNSTVAATSPTVAGVTLDGGLGVAGDIWTADNGDVIIGTGGDLTLAHDGTDSTITNTTGATTITSSGTGAMTITNTPAQTFNLATTTTGTVEVGATAGTVSFNSTVAATSPTVAGVTLDGGLGVAGDIWTADNGDVIIGTGGDLTLAHDGTDSTITNTTGAMTLTSSGTGAMTITNTVGQDMNIATTTTTGNINIGTALTTGDITMGGATTTSVVTIQGTADASSATTGALVVGGGAGFGGKVYGTSFHSLSDARFKSNIMPLSESLNTVRKMETYSYNLNDAHDDGLTHYGVLAQQLESIGLGEMVSGEGSNQKAVDYTAIIPFLIGAVKELSDKIETMETQKESSKNFRFR